MIKDRLLLVRLVDYLCMPSSMLCKWWHRCRKQAITRYGLRGLPTVTAEILDDLLWLWRSCAMKKLLQGIHILIQPTPFLASWINDVRSLRVLRNAYVFVFACFHLFSTITVFWIVWNSCLLLFINETGKFIQYKVASEVSYHITSPWDSLVLFSFLCSWPFHLPFAV